MPRKLFISSVVILVIGIVVSILASNASYVDAQGMVHDSLATPIGALMIVLGVILLLVSGVIFIVKSLKK